LKKVEPAFVYFESKCDELATQLGLYEAARMFHPLLARSMQLTPEKVNELAGRILFISNNPSMLSGLTTNLGKYLQQVTLLKGDPADYCDPSKVDIEAIWHSSPFRSLAFWHEAALQCVLHQPSSAPVERVFSILKSVVGDLQGKLLEDYQAGAMMTNYNQRERRREVYT
jgi:hypothetical protein